MYSLAARRIQYSALTGLSPLKSQNFRVEGPDFLKELMESFHEARAFSIKGPGFSV